MQPHEVIDLTTFVLSAGAVAGLGLFASVVERQPTPDGSAAGWRPTDR